MQFSAQKRAWYRAAGPMPHRAAPFPPYEKFFSWGSRHHCPMEVGAYEFMYYRWLEGLEHCWKRRRTGWHQLFMTYPADVPRPRPDVARNSYNREGKCAENYNKWHNKFIFLNCNQHFGNFEPQQFPGAVWQDCFRYFILKISLYFSIGNGQSREPAMCQLYRYTFNTHCTTVSIGVILSFFWLPRLRWRTWWSLELADYACNDTVKQRRLINYNCLHPSYRQTTIIDVRAIRWY